MFWKQSGLAGFHKRKVVLLELKYTGKLLFGGWVEQYSLTMKQRNLF